MLDAAHTSKQHLSPEDQAMLRPGQQLGEGCTLTVPHLTLSGWEIWGGSHKAPHLKIKGFITVEN